MAKPSYSELLRHPLWQKKRLEILELHKFTCEVCRDKESTLHIHHGYYETGLMPWEYGNETLHCLCEGCHGEVQRRLTRIHRLIARFISEPDLDQIIGYVLAMVLASFPEIEGVVQNHETALGMSDYFKSSAEDILGARSHDGWISAASFLDWVQARHDQRCALEVKQTAASGEPRRLSVLLPVEDLDAVSEGFEDYENDPENAALMRERYNARRRNEGV